MDGLSLDVLINTTQRRVNMKQYVWFCLRTNELVITNLKKYPKSSKTSLIILDETGYWNGLFAITSGDFIQLGEL